MSKRDRIDDVFEQTIQSHGRAMITNLSILVRLTDIYASANEAVKSASARFMAELWPLMQDLEELSVRMASESFFIDDIRVKATTTDLENFGNLIRAMQKRGIGGFVFRSSLATETVMEYVTVFSKNFDFATIQAALEALGGQMLVEQSLRAVASEEIDMKDTRMLARRAYAKAVSALMDVHKLMRSGKSLNVKRAKRSVQSLVDSLMKDERYLLRLAGHSKSRHHYFVHSVNVTILSMALARRLGLGKLTLSKLGMATLFHDLGLDPEQAEAQTDHKLSPQEINEFEQHPVDGVRTLLNSRGINEVSMLSMLVTYEHHMNLDMLGYPQPSRMWNPSIYSRIVRIADEYETLASGRLYRQKPMAPDKVLEIMNRMSGNAYDPGLYSEFCRMIRPGSC